MNYNPSNKTGIHDFHDRWGMDGWKGGFFLIAECWHKCEGEWQSWQIPFCNHHSEDYFGLDSSLVAQFRGKVWWAGYLHLKVSFHRWLLRYKAGAVTITMYIGKKKTQKTPWIVMKISNTNENRQTLYTSSCDTLKRIHYYFCSILAGDEKSESNLQEKWEKHKFSNIL